MGLIKFIRNFSKIDTYYEELKSHESNYIAHVNGYTYKKLHDWLQELGIKFILYSGYRSSIMPELRELGFDNHASASIFIEAFKF